MHRAVFGVGLAQVAITTAAGMAALYLVGYGWKPGLVLGGALAMSSTAIVTKMLAERMELGTHHGRDSLGILLFQDLAVVAFLIIIPSLGKAGGEMAMELSIAAVKAAIALTLILFFGQRPMRAWFHVVARQRSSELFVLNVLLVTLGLAGLTAALGLSMALGAFLAGMLIAETEYRYQVEEDIKPFRDVLLGLFFMTVGMALDLEVVFENVGLVMLLLLVPVVAKFGLIVALARGFGSPLSTALRTGFYLAQAGELALVMLAMAVEHSLIPMELKQPVLAAMILSMLTAPVVIQYAEPIVRKLTANDWLARAAQVTQIAAKTMSRQDHIVICGYGRSGQNLARLLEAEDIQKFGRLMNECHVSLRDLYEVSCPELDVMVRIAQSLEGCYGARLTGAGFGGCTVNLVAWNNAEEFSRSLAIGYETETGSHPEIYITRASKGAELLS